MAQLAVQRATLAGIAPTYNVTAAAGDTFFNDGKTYLHIKNANGAATRTVTINSLVNCDQGVDHNAEIVVPISGERVVGPFPRNRFNTAAGLVGMTYTSEADLTIAVVSVF